MGSWARINIGVQVIVMIPTVKDVIRHCCVIPLLPQHLLQRGLDLIGARAYNRLHPAVYECVRTFLMYVQEEWLDHANRGQTLSVCSSEHQTNNARYIFVNLK